MNIHRYVKQRGQIFREITMLKRALKTFKLHSETTFQVTVLLKKWQETRNVNYFKRSHNLSDHCRKNEKPSYGQNINKALNNSENLDF